MGEHRHAAPMLWNSTATGKTADRHGILGFLEPDPETGTVRPVTSTSRRVKALWNILTQRGLRTHVLGWYAGHPAEPVNGVAVSPLYQLATGPLETEWKLPDASVHPARLGDTLAGLRMHPFELGAREVLPFVPRAGKIDQKEQAEPRLPDLHLHMGEAYLRATVGGSRARLRKSGGSGSR